MIENKNKKLSALSSILAMSSIYTSAYSDMMDIDDQINSRRKSGETKTVRNNLDDSGNVIQNGHKPFNIEVNGNWFNVYAINEKNAIKKAKKEYNKLISTEQK